MPSFNSDSFSNNPFAAPETMTYPGDSDTRPVVAIRQQHLSHEASVQSIGMLYLLACLLCSLSSVIFLIQVRMQNAPEAVMVLGTVLLMVGIGLGFIGVGVRRLQGWTRIPVTLFSVLGLFLVPLGTIINGYILYLIYSSRGTVVFSDEYKEVIRQTPDIKYRTSVIVWIFVLLLFAVLSLVATLLFFA